MRRTGWLSLAVLLLSTSIITAVARAAARCYGGDYEYATTEVDAWSIGNVTLGVNQGWDFRCVDNGTGNPCLYCVRAKVLRRYYTHTGFNDFVFLDWLNS